MKVEQVQRWANLQVSAFTKAQVASASKTGSACGTSTFTKTLRLPSVISFTSASVASSKMLSIL